MLNLGMQEKKGVDYLCRFDWHHLLGEFALSLTTHRVMHILYDLDCSLKTVAEGMCPLLANSRFDVVYGSHGQDLCCEGCL